METIKSTITVKGYYCNSLEDYLRQMMTPDVIR